MNSALFHTPVLFLIYNRPEHTRKVFDVIRQLRPSHLYLAADGPREHIPGDREKCEATREITKAVDWECSVFTLFRDKNKSTKYAVPDAIDWFFKSNELGIILEDDCVPDLSFFNFCEKLLEKYKTDERVMHINGSNYLKGKKYNFKGSYYFSRLCHPWGWATWKRAWDLYDFEMENLDQFIRADKLTLLTSNKEWRNYYYDFLTKTKNGQIDTWDIQWFYTVWKHSGYVITPTINLVSNIGFGNDATNTNYEITRLAEMKKGKVKQIQPDDSFIVNTKADQRAVEIKVKEGRGNLLQKINHKLKLIFKTAGNHHLFI